MKKSISGTLLSTSLLLSVSAFAGGIPNLWVDGFVQGFETYDLTNSQGLHAVKMLHSMNLQVITQ